ncbi:neuronal acetylcholine receptor subunit alpha-7-like [Scleropages formosus]|uniref:Neuronal acetylcholine receptor subunit alpha-7-like n=1 Tax=Scleropages formosus TaxID=113540 RepID=A0A0P7TLT8_SCLFO|nr:neuronal acetylcholine receptor subunit alpha-7-like [Scleropages formosus]
MCPPLFCTVVGSLQGEYQRKLYKELMENYTRLERPVLNDSAPILVELGMTLLQIIDVYWTDVYLTWNPDHYPGVQNLRFPSNQVWVPDILLYNSADERFDATFHTNVLVNASGYCQYIPPGILKSTCYIDVRWFPFDVQKCDLKFGSWTYNGWLLDLQMLAVDISTYISNGEWDLVDMVCPYPYWDSKGVPGKRNELYYDCCKEPYPDVTFTVTMRRRTLYYGLNLLIPCVLISGLALLVFLLPADSGEKISLGITVLLSLTVFMLLVAEIMPATSDSVPLIAQYFASTMMIVGFSVVVTVLVLQFHHHDPQGGKMPKWLICPAVVLVSLFLLDDLDFGSCPPTPQVRVVLLNWCAWFLRMKQPGEDRRLLGYKFGHPALRHASSSSSIEMNPVSGQMAGGSSSNGNMNIYYSYHTVENPCFPPSSDSGVMCGRTPGSPAEDGERSGPLCEHLPEITKILEEVRYIAQRFRDQDEAEAVCSEWKFAAAVVDRLCLVAFSLFSIICTFSILMSAPNFIDAVSKDFT